MTDELSFYEECQAVVQDCIARHLAKDYVAFCEHYELDADAAESREQYEEARAALEAKDMFDD